MSIFIKAIPANLYAFLTLIMVSWIAIRKNADYGVMRRIERVSRSGHAFAPEKVIREGIEEVAVVGNGRVLDLVVPIASLVVLAFLSLAYYGGYWNCDDGVTLLQAMGASEPGRALAVSALAAIMVTCLLMVPRKVLTFHQFSAAILRGFKTMMPALVMLTLAWGLSGVCNDLLGTGSVLAKFVGKIGIGGRFLPAISFVLAALFAFATGASWAVIGIVTPVIFQICNAADPMVTVLSLSASLAGAVMGDHCSPIADTTILSSAGAGCRHMTHISTQMPYALTTGVICLAGYLAMGIFSHCSYGYVVSFTLWASIIILLVFMFFMEARRQNGNR